jgi:hypothetical protein
MRRAWYERPFPEETACWQNEAMHTMSEDDSTEKTPSLESMLKLAIQVLGILLVLAGAYYVILILTTGIRISRDPSELATTMDAWSNLLKLQDVTVQSGTSKIAVGPPAATAMIYLWYFLTGAIALSLIGAGGKLVSSAMPEKEQFLAALKQLFQKFRNEEERSALTMSRQRNR